MSRRLVYRFARGSAEGRSEWRNLLGGKGANLAEMANMGIPVPPGFTITTESCVDYLQNGVVTDELVAAVRESVAWLEQQTGHAFGGTKSPLLVSVRSGARVSMPGMMDTVLDLGLNDKTVVALANRSGSERFAFDAYRRFLTMYGDVVLGVERSLFDQALADARRRAAEAMGIDGDDETLGRKVPDSVIPAAELRTLVADCQQIVLRETGKPFPSDPVEQLMGAIRAVFDSWNTPRAAVYRDMHKISATWGTAVNVQAMVFGNLGDTSATGVAFTRDPSTGEKRFFGEWLPNAQGEDVVAGVRTPRPLLASNATEAGASLEEAMPVAFAELFDIQDRLERHYRDMQDLEFTIEDNVLWILQTRNGKRSARASVRIAVEMVGEGLLNEQEAILRVDAGRLTELLFPAIDPKAPDKPIARGIGASPGAVTGMAVFDADEAEKRAAEGDDVILVRTETSPEDLHGMKAALGILTARGGATSHAAVVARGMGRPCVSGVQTIGVSERDRAFVAHAADGAILAKIKEGDVITIDGSRGMVFRGNVRKMDAELTGELGTLLEWAHRVRGMQVRANADTPEQAQRALQFGAEGIGLCRTEHMFFDEERIAAMREMILATDEPARRTALAKLLPHQIADFEELFRTMRGHPVNIRLLDPPLHEFLPTETAQITELARAMHVSQAEVRRRVADLHESNPMLGHRGVRLAITFPEIPRMQMEAILTAACRVKKEGIPAFPEVMIPLSLDREELAIMKALLREVAVEVFEAENVEVEYQFGTMIELPRAALLAADLAEEAQFFSFGTNDLTQTTLGLSRDDAGRFLHSYVVRGILGQDPFVSIDQNGVGQLVRIGCEGGRETRPEIKIGVCGEHGGDPASIEFFDTVGLHYVSCSPFRVPIARLAVAQAALRRLR